MGKATLEKILTKLEVQDTKLDFIHGDVKELKTKADLTNGKVLKNCTDSVKHEEWLRGLTQRVEVVEGNGGGKKRSLLGSIFRVG